MSQVLNIETLRSMAVITIDIPDFEGTGTIKVRVQKPRLMALAAQGKIPNMLMSVAAQAMGMGKRQVKNKEDVMKEMAQMMELYCKACLVEPTYEEFKDIMTDEQMMAIFDWAMGDVKQLESFRTDKEDGADNNTGEALPEKAE